MEIFWNFPTQGVFYIDEHFSSLPLLLLEKEHQPDLHPPISYIRTEKYVLRYFYFSAIDIRVRSLLSHFSQSHKLFDISSASNFVKSEFANNLLLQSYKTHMTFNKWKHNTVSIVWKYITAIFDLLSKTRRYLFYPEKQKFKPIKTFEGRKSIFWNCVFGSSYSSFESK